MFKIALTPRRCKAHAERVRHPNRRDPHRVETPCVFSGRGRGGRFLDSHCGVVIVYEVCSGERGICAVASDYSKNVNEYDHLRHKFAKRIAKYEIHDKKHKKRTKHCCIRQTLI